MLEVRGLVKRFGGFTALNGVTLAVKAGERFGLIGPNGSGKTTALNLMSGFLAPERGRVWLDGKEVTSARPVKLARRGLLRMFQSTRVFARLSA